MNLLLVPENIYTFFFVVLFWEKSSQYSRVHCKARQNDLENSDLHSYLFINDSIDQAVEWNFRLISSDEK